MKPTWRRLLFLLVVMTALLAAGCGGDDESSSTTAAGTGASATDTAGGGKKPKIVLGTKNFTEQYILGELYRQALEAKGYDVTLKSDIGSTEIIDTALTSGQINVYPEYTGTALTVVFGEPGSKDTAQATYDEAKARYEERGQTLYAMTPFSDSDAIAVTIDTARTYSLKTLEDLKKVPDLTLGGQPEFSTREQGLPGLKKNYGLTDVKFVPFAGISPYEALDANKVKAAAIFSTDAPLVSGKYVVLEDPKAQFGFQNVAPVVDKELADAGGQELQDVFDAVSKLLTEKAIITMNSVVSEEQQSPDAVAKAFLDANGLL
ncbi:MAG: glycine betaine ABC transporter substrate-binding protein [Pseudomonadota bacterium]